MNGEPQGPDGPPPSEPYAITEDGEADQGAPSAPPGTPASQEPTPDGPATRSASTDQGIADEITTDFPGMPLPGSTPRGTGGDRAASEADPGSRPTSGPGPSPAEPAPARRSRPPDCPYPQPRADLGAASGRDDAMRDVSSMSARVCLACGEPLPSWSRVDKTTCNPGCRTRLCRTRKVACNTSVTRSSATAPRSGGQANEVPPAGQTGPFGASGERRPSPHQPGRPGPGGGLAGR